MSKFKLPNGVNLDNVNYNMIELDEIRGRHQNILVNPKAKTPFDYIQPILTDVIKDITDIQSNSVLSKVTTRDLVLHHLPIQDLQFILIKLREVSYGNDFMLDLECTHCKAMNAAKLDLSSLAVIPRKDKVEEDQAILPKAKLAIKYKHMSLSNLLQMNFEDEDSQFMKTLKTSIAAFRIASLGDKTNITSKDIEDLPALDLEYIEENAPDLAEPDMKIEHTCKACDKDFESDISTRILAADFLYHSRT